MKKQAIGGALIALAATFAVTGAATAAPGTKTFDQTYPAASALCAKASAGTLGKRLEPHQAAVSVACSTLSNAFGPLQATVTLAEQTYANAIAADKAKVAAVCPPANRVGRPACRDARSSAHLANQAARLTRHEADQTYHDSIDSNRHTFWDTISALRSAS